MEKISKYLLNLLGWKTVGKIPADIKKMILIEAPHTSNWDYLFGMLSVASMGIKINLIIKKELFFWPVGPFLKALGGIPIDRKGTSNKVEALANLFEHQDIMRLAITPEGTRSLSIKWKKGFYFVALKAQVPILLSSLDYKHKIGRFGEVLYPTGDYDKDLKKIEAFYRGVKAKYPERFNLT